MGMNHRLKSVDHMPWKVLTYQAINTFIDDVFALCIRMPEIQKYSVFRDDIVFIMCCVQRWLYRKAAPATKRQEGKDKTPLQKKRLCRQDTLQDASAENTI